jgi:AcrR family transcriptional regulator
VSVRKLKTTRQSEIVEAAVAIAREKGLDALSMRRVAERLGLTPMALYGYFRNKDDLLDGIVGYLLTLLPDPDPALDWRDRLRLTARGARDVARSHPAVFPLLFARPSVSREAVLAVDRIHQALLDGGVADDQVARIERLVSTFVLGFAISEVSGRFSDSTLNLRGRRARLGPEELPAHHRLAAWLDPEVDWDAEFEADLADLLIVIESKLGGAKE